MTDEELKDFDIGTAIGRPRTKDELDLRLRLAAAEDLCGEAILEIGRHVRSPVFNQVLYKWLSIRG